MKKGTMWLIGFVIALLGVFGFFYYAYTFKPPEFVLPKFSYLSIIIIFVVTFIPSIISRWVANLLSKQIDADLEGFVSTIQDAFYGWLTYYSLMVVAFILYDYFIFGEFPQFW
jgi:drug/metabolite transporter (DMT)-like permease